MINPFTCVCVVLAAGSGLFLYQEKHQAEMLDRRIEQVLHAADVAHARIGVLRAEYALLGDPSRLQELAKQHLPTLVNTDPKQFTNLAELDRRLPPVGAPPAATPPPLEPAAPLATLPPPASAQPTPAPPAPAQPVIALAAPAPVDSATPVGTAAPAAKASAMAMVAAVQATPISRAPRATPRASLRVAAIHLPPSSPHSTYAAYHPDAYVPPPSRTQEAMAGVAHDAPVSASPMVASALGMARALPGSSPVNPIAAANFYTGGPQR